MPQPYWQKQEQPAIRPGCVIRLTKPVHKTAGGDIPAGAVVQVTRQLVRGQWEVRVSQTDVTVASEAELLAGGEIVG